jgi:hypothetical protein
MYQKKFIKEAKKIIKTDLFQLSVKLAIIVPSTSEYSKKISKKEFQLRIKEVQTKLGKMFGGFSTIDTNGGYFYEKDKKIIQEKTSMVISYATKKSFNSKNIKQLILYVQSLKQKWSQDAIGLIIENDLFYI